MAGLNSTLAMVELGVLPRDYDAGSKHTSDGQGQTVPPLSKPSELRSTVRDNTYHGEQCRVWMPAAQVLGPDITKPNIAASLTADMLERSSHASQDTHMLSPSTETGWLSSYRSSPSVTRTFCARCGTNLFSMMQPMPAGWPSMLNVLLGSVDREDLESQWMKPDRHVFWDDSIGWVKGMCSEDGMVRHPQANLNDTVK
jgi:hypothetical protein